MRYRELGISEKYERALWELTAAQAEVRECERILAVEYASEQGPPDESEDCSDAG